MSGFPGLDEAELQPIARSAPAQYLVLTYSAWGHTRPLLSLTLALLLRHPHLTATLLIYDPLLPKCLAEIDKWRLGASDRARLQISSFGSEATKGEGLVRREAVSSVGELAVEAYAAHYIAHVLNSPPPANDNPTSDAVRTTAIILDASIAPAFLARKRALDASAFGESAREEQGRNGEKRVKVLTFHPASSGYVGFTFFKDSPLPPLVAKGVADLAAGRKQSVKQVWEEIYLNNHTLVPVVGQEPVFMYELEPSRHLPLDPWLSNMHALQTLYAASGTEIDGLIVAWPFDGEVQAASETTFGVGAFYQVGALVPPASAVSSSAAEESRKEEEGQRQGVMGFLDRCADKEVLFISFGSIFFPPSTHQTRLLLATLLETHTKFILVVGAAEPATVALMREVLLLPQSDARGGQGKEWWFEQRWVDQLAILFHPSTSFFLTHAGSNSVLESISLSIPLVLWPGTFDQPLIASQLVSLGVGVELLQVRLRKGMTARGVDVVGTDQAIRDEMKGVWEMVGGRRKEGGKQEELKGYRRRAREMGERWKAEKKRGGGSWDAIGRLGRL